MKHKKKAFKPNDKGVLEISTQNDNITLYRIENHTVENFSIAIFLRENKERIFLILNNELVKKDSLKISFEVLAEYFRFHCT